MFKTNLISPRFKKNNSKIIEPFSDPQRAKYSIELQENIQQNYHLLSEACFCGEQNGYLIAEYDRYGILINSVLCSNCGTVRIDPYFDQESASHFYTHIYQGLYGRSSDKEEYFSRQQKYGEKYYVIAKKYLTAGDTILEIGCGAGGALSIFQNKGFQVAGVDYDQPLLDYGKNRGVKNLFYGSLTELKDKGTFKAKLIYLNHVLEHVIEPRKILEDCTSLLAKNGIIIIAVPDILGITLNDAYEGNLLNMIHIAHKYNYSFSGIKYLANFTGYKSERLFPSKAIKTHTSNSGEMWILLKKIEFPSDKIKTGDQYSAGILNKLKLYEKKYQLNNFWKNTNKKLINLARKIKNRILFNINKKLLTP